MDNVPRIQKEEINKYIIGILFLALAYCAYVILSGFLIPIFIGMVLAYSVYPLYRRLLKRTKSERTAAIIISILAISVLVALSLLLVPELLGELGRLINLYETGVPQQIEELKNCTPESGDPKCIISIYVTKYLDESTLDQIIPAVVKPASEFIVRNLVSFFQNLPTLILQLTIILFSTSYFLHNGKNIVQAAAKTVPLKQSNKDRIIKRIDEVMKAVVYGNILTAFVEGVAATVILIALDVNMAFIAGLLVMFFALIPPFGAMIIWGPIAVALLLLGRTMEGLVFGALCLIVMGYIDNLARPMVIGRKVQLSAFWVLLGVLGGMGAFGFAGIILGPLILSLFVTIMKIFGEELSENTEAKTLEKWTDQKQ